MKPAAPPLRTYSHLAGLPDVPSEYEIVSSRLLPYVSRGFELEVPVADWYRRHQQGSPLALADWERFSDPRQTTYAAYTKLSAAKESHLDAVMRAADASRADTRLPAVWIAELGQILPVVRYIWHGFQMMAAYLGQMAPGGKLTLVALFQAADEMRRIHRVSERIGRLRELAPDFGADARARWETEAAFQPARKAIEMGLVAYDWGETFVALCLAQKPLFDDFVLVQLGERARAAGDFVTAQMLSSFAEDALWHRQWAAALVAVATREEAKNRDVLAAWRDRWIPLARDAVTAIGPLFGDAAAAITSASRGFGESWLRDLGLP